MNKTIIFLILTLILFSACKKETEVRSDGAASILVVNAVTGVPSLYVTTNTVPSVYATMPTINYGASAFLYAERKSTPVIIATSDDTTKLALKKDIDVSGKIYSMFLLGPASDIETIVKEETNFPFIQIGPSITPDSTIHVRFVNLSSNSSALKIRIQGGTSNEVSALEFKGITEFFPYAAKAENLSYVYEIIDPATDMVITTYTLNVTSANRFKNVALVFKGLQGGTPSVDEFSVSEVNYF